jgi:hypothetical protein
LPIETGNISLLGIRQFVGSGGECPASTPMAKETHGFPQTFVKYGMRQTSAVVVATGITGQTGKSTGIFAPISDIVTRRYVRKCSEQSQRRFFQISRSASLMAVAEPTVINTNLKRR